MRIDVRELELGALTLTGEVPVADLKLDSSDVHVLGQIVVKLWAEKQGREIRVRGRFTVDIELPCARCLDPVKAPILAEFDQFYQSNTHHHLTGEIELREKDTEVAFFCGDFIEVSDIVREQILLGLPMKPICREDCRGLCAYCGKNRNVEACNCHSLFVDPRLAPLLQLRNRMKF